MTGTNSSHFCVVKSNSISFEGFISAVLSATIKWPSGDQTGAINPAEWGSGDTLRDLKSTIRITALGSCHSPAKAREFPSGDHVGSNSGPGPGITCSTGPPSAEIKYALMF